jgi:hypothetical protein
VDLPSPLLAVYNSSIHRNMYKGMRNQSTSMKVDRKDNIPPCSRAKRSKEEVKDEQVAQVDAQVVQVDEQVAQAEEVLVVQVVQVVVQVVQVVAAAEAVEAEMEAVVADPVLISQVQWSSYPRQQIRVKFGTVVQSIRAMQLSG